MRNAQASLDLLNYAETQDPETSKAMVTPLLVVRERPEDQGF